MQKVDRIGWAAGISLRTYGVRIGVRANSEEVLEMVKSRLPCGWKPAKSPVVDSLYSILGPRAIDRPNVRRFNFVYKGWNKLARSMNLDEVLREFEIDLHSYVASVTRQRMFLQAGVVGWRGRAIVIPGKDFSGKTSLVTAMSRAGATYYSDEFAVLDSRGRVHPCPWALHIREGERAPREIPVAVVGRRAGTKPLPIGLVVFSEYQQGAKWRPRPLTQGQAALAMLGNVMSTRHRPETMLPMLGKVVSAATVLKGVRGEADEVVQFILKGSVDNWTQNLQT